MSTEKPCACKCGKTIIRKPTEGAYNWFKHKWFSPKCKNRGATRKARVIREKSASRVTRAKLAYTNGFIQKFLCGRFK